MKAAAFDFRLCWPVTQSILEDWHHFSPRRHETEEVPCPVKRIWGQNLPITCHLSWLYLSTLSFCVLHATHGRKWRFGKLIAFLTRSQGNTLFLLKLWGGSFDIFIAPSCVSWKEEWRSSHIKQMQLQIFFIIKAMLSQMYTRQFYCTTNACVARVNVSIESLLV